MVEDVWGVSAEELQLDLLFEGSSAFRSEVWP
jgi:hypothetical protein